MRGAHALRASEAAAGRGAGRRQQRPVPARRRCRGRTGRPARRDDAQRRRRPGGHPVAPHRSGGDACAGRDAGAARRHMSGIGSGDNPYFGMLALADAIVVTMDSVSMISEAVATAAPVMLARLPGRSRRNGLFIEEMLTGWPCPRIRRQAGTVAGDTARRHGGSRGGDVPPARSAASRRAMLNIQTFDNRVGGNVLYKALAHPLAAEAIARLYAHLTGTGRAVRSGGHRWRVVRTVSGCAAIRRPLRARRHRSGRGACWLCGARAD